MSSQKSKKEELPVCRAARAIGFVKPKFNPKAQGFYPPQLRIIGTAFLMKEHEVIITCAHVVKKFINSPIEISGMLVIGKGKKYKKISIAAVSFFHDLAILHFEKPPKVDKEKFNNNLKKEFVETGLEFVDQKLKPSMEVEYAGYPFGDRLLNKDHDPNYASGVISVKPSNDSLNKIRITGSIAKGFSGAPVVLKEKREKLVGVVSSSPSKKISDANIFMSISWKHVKVFLELFSRK